MRRKFVYPIAVVILSLYSSCMENAHASKEVEDLYSQAIKFHNTGNYGKALQYYKQVIEKEAGHADALYNRANIYGYLKQYDLAISDYKQVTELAPDFPGAYGQLGWYLIVQGKFTEARSFCQKAHDLDPDNYGWATNLGHACFLTGYQKRAREYYRKAIDLIPSEAEFKMGPMADFTLFMDKGWQVSACRMETIWLSNLFADLQKAAAFKNKLFILGFLLLILFWGLAAYGIYCYERVRISASEKESAGRLYGVRRKINLIALFFIICCFVGFNLALFSTGGKQLLSSIKTVFEHWGIGPQGRTLVFVIGYMVTLGAIIMPGLLWIEYGYYRLDRLVRKTTWSYKTYSLHYIVSFGLALLPYILWNMLLLMIPDNDTVICLSFCIFLFVIYAVAPLLIQCVSRTEPLTDLDLTERIGQLFERSGMRRCPVIVVTTPGDKEVNAQIAGILPFLRRIVLTDRLINSMTPNEIVAVIAYEIGHAKKKHLWVFFALGIVFYVLTLHAIPVLISTLLFDCKEAQFFWWVCAIWIIWLGCFGMLCNLFSRQFEKQADAYAVNLTGNQSAYLSMLNKLAKLNYMPKQWHKTDMNQTHPSIQKRMDFVTQI